MKISIIVATDSFGGIGNGESLPWKCPGDLKLFKERTMNHFVIVGRITWESMKSKLPGRKVIVLTSQTRYRSDKPIFGFANTLADALEMAKCNHEREVFIIGGESVYNAAINIATTLYVTRIPGDYSCDKFFPPINLEVWKLSPKVAPYMGECLYYVCVYTRT